MVLGLKARLNYVRKNIQGLKDVTSQSNLHLPSLNSTERSTELHAPSSNPSSHFVSNIKDVRLLSDLVILVMGATGGGKSSIINHIAAAGEEIIRIKHLDLNSSSDYAVVRVSTRRGNVCFIEVPETRSAQFHTLYQRYNVIGIIFIHKVIDTRIAGDLLRDFNEIKKACRDDPMLSSHIVCVTSHWSSNACENQQELNVEKELITSDDGWGKEVRDGELEFRRFHLGDQAGAKSILDHLMTREERPWTVVSEECGDEELLTARDWKIVVIMGVTGAGKSNFIAKARNARDDDTMLDDSLDSQTKEIKAFKVHIHGQKLILVDTPGFDDTYRSDLDILRTIARWLETTFRQKILLDGIIYLHRITDNRMSGSAVSNIELFKGLVGKGLASKNVKFVTTMWDSDTRGEGRKREEELKTNPKYWGNMVNSGADVKRFENSNESALDILKSFRSGWHQQQALQLQVELVKQHQRLKETTAGQSLYRKLGELLEEHQKILEKRPLRAGYEFSEDEEYGRLMNKLTKVKDEMKELHIGLNGRLNALLNRAWYAIFPDKAYS